MQGIIKNHKLLSENTFHIDVNCKYYFELNQLDQFNELIETDVFIKSEKLILGGGSNLLFTKNFDGFVLKNSLKGIEIIREDENHVYVKVGAGENWHKFVMWSVARNLGGIENLSLIPGNVGASPMQNIGAYGVEIKDVFESLTAVSLKTSESVNFSNTDCEFGYRESVFKRKFRNQFLISSVTFRLSKKPVFNISYGTIAQELEKYGVLEVSVKAVSDAVIRIRQSKLPAPEKIGNAGSFFKNPEISSEEFKKISLRYPDVVAYPLESGNYKLAAGWLIEKSGWKGFREGDAGVHSSQALVLVNYGSATGKEIYDLSSKILESVQNNFGVNLEREVNIY